TWSTPLTTIFETSAVPWTSMMTAASVIVPGGGRVELILSRSARVKLYVAVPSALTTGVTLLQPRKYVCGPVVEVAPMLNRGEPPWHWVVLASVNDADVNGWPVRPVMSPKALAFVAVGQFFSRWSTPLLKLACGQPVPPGSKTPGTRTAPAGPATASAHAAIAAMIIFRIFPPWDVVFRLSLKRDFGPRSCGPAPDRSPGWPPCYCSPLGEQSGSARSQLPRALPPRPADDRRAPDARPGDGRRGLAGPSGLEAGGDEASEGAGGRRGRRTPSPRPHTRPAAPAARAAGRDAVARTPSRAVGGQVRGDRGAHRKGGHGMTEMGTETTALKLTHRFAAPRDEVFDAWTNPDVLRKWWSAADTWSTPVAEVDARPGGRYRLSMKTNQGEIHTVGGEYQEVDRPERLVYTGQWEEGPEPVQGRNDAVV